MMVPQHVCNYMHHAKFSAIDQHKHQTQGTLYIERNIQTKSWGKCLINSILIMFAVGAWLMNSGRMIYFIHPNTETDQQQLYFTLT